MPTALSDINSTDGIIHQIVCFPACQNINTIYNVENDNKRI
jgi:hypothetical protein